MWTLNNFLANVTISLIQRVSSVSKMCVDVSEIIATNPNC